MEMSLILAKMLYTYDIQLLEPDLDYEGESKVHIQWWKPELRIRFRSTKCERR